MGLIELINKIRGLRQEEQEEILGDDETRDKYLRSLRRQRRVQMEEVEKEQLKKKIAAYQKARERRYLWGIEEKKKKLKQQRNMLQNGHNILKQKKDNMRNSIL